MKNCYNANEINGRSNAGGIFGNLNTNRNKESGVTNATISNCYNAGTIKNTNTNAKTSGIIGYEKSDASGDLYVSNCYYEIGTADYGRANNSNSGCISTTKDAIISQIENLADFVEDIDNINSGYPILDWQVESTE